MTWGGRNGKCGWRVETYLRGADILNLKPAGVDAGRIWPGTIRGGDQAQVFIDAVVIEWSPQGAEHGVLTLLFPDLLVAVDGGGSMILRFDMRSTVRRGRPLAWASPTMR